MHATRAAFALLMMVTLALAGCATQRTPSSSRPPAAPETLPDKYERSYVVFGKRYYVLRSADGFVEQGLASWYGPQFHGRKTANGETYDMHGVTAAHKNLPLGTWVRVTNLNNQRTLDLRINDRGPFVDDRVIDLSMGAAEILDVIRPGTAPVRVVALQGRPAEPVAPPPEEAVVTATIDRPAVIQSRPAPAEPRPAPALSTQESAPITAPTTSPSAVTAPPATPTMPSSVNSEPAFRPNGFIQVASFGEPGNARRMVSQLEQSGFDNVIIQSQDVDGRSVFRVRLGPLTSAAQQQTLLDRLSAMGLLGARVVSQ